VIGVQTQSVKGTAWMTFTVEIGDSARLARVLGVVAGVSGVRSARRRLPITPRGTRRPAPSLQNSAARCSTAAPLGSTRGMNISRTWPSTQMLGTASGMVPLL
jgi:hypothetical protein